MVIYVTMETVLDSFVPTSSRTATLLPYNYYVILPFLQFIVLIEFATSSLSYSKKGQYKKVQ